MAEVDKLNLNKMPAQTDASKNNRKAEQAPIEFNFFGGESQDSPVISDKGTIWDASTSLGLNKPQEEKSDFSTPFLRQEKEVPKEAPKEDRNASLNPVYKEHAKFVDHTSKLDGYTLEAKVKEVYPDSDETAIKAVMEYNHLKNTNGLSNKELRFPGELKTESGEVYAYPDSADEVAKNVLADNKAREIKQTCEEQPVEQVMLTPEQMEAQKVQDKQLYEEHEKNVIHTMTLKPGENLWNKTKEVYPGRDKSVIDAIIEYNGITDATKIPTDKELRFPAHLETKSGKYTAFPDSAEYVVENLKEKSRIDGCIEELTSKDEGGDPPQIM